MVKWIPLNNGRIGLKLCEGATDVRTRGQGDMEARGQGDMETRGQGDMETRGANLAT